jgi:TIR domain
MPEHRVFVSYSRKDAELVGPLVQLLRMTGEPVFLDTDSIPPGCRWRAVLTDAIDGCEMFLVFWCCHSSASVEVKKECSQALELRKRLVPVLLDDTQLSPELAEYQTIDLRRVLDGHDEVPVDVRVPGTFKMTTRREWRLRIPSEQLLLAAARHLSACLERMAPDQEC